MNNLKAALKRVEDIVNVYPDLSDTSARMESCYIELNTGRLACINSLAFKEIRAVVVFFAR